MEARMIQLQQMIEGWEMEKCDADSADAEYGMKMGVK